MVRLQYIGHSAFQLADGSNSVLIDPFISNNPSATVAAADFTPNTILITHAHDDHVGDTLEIAQRSGALVITTFELGEWLERQGAPNVMAANHGGTVQFAGGSVKFTQAIHTSSYTLPDGSLAATGAPAGLVVRFGGKTTYFAGDTALFSDMKLIGEEGLDLAVLPIGDLYTMGPADAVRATMFLEPDIVVPCHYNTFSAINQDAAAFKNDVESRTKTRCEILAPGESLEL